MMLNRFISDRRTLFLLFFCSHIINVLAGTYTVTIGDGSSSSEVVPICNWHMNTYFGSQCFYSESQLSNAGLKRGDRIKSISFYCKSGGSSGGSFNVRIKNINSSSFSSIEDMSQVTIFSKKTLNPYAPGQWITFNSSSSTSQFTYNGKSIVVDIRNTSRGNQQLNCFFSATNYSHSSAAWFNSPSENVIGNYSFENYQPVIKITYESSNPPGPPFNIVLNKSNIWLDMGETEKLYGWRSTDNQIINDLLWQSSDNTVATVDEYGKVTARNIGSATITAYGRYGGYDISASCNVTVRYNHNTEYDFEQNGIRYRVKPNNYNEVIVTGSVHNSSTYSQLHLTIPPIVNNYGRFYTVTEIGSYAFNNKNILVQISLPNTLRCIGDYAFSGNPLSSLNFTTPLSSIGVGAFANCILTNITIPESVTCIGEKAFKGNKLNYVMCYIKEPLSINANTFDWVGLFINASLGVPYASIDKYRSKYPWSHFASIFSIGGGSTTVQATDISLNKSSTILTIGSTETLVATVTPSNATNKTVSWKSSNTSVATVDQNGKVTAKAVGTANITATTTDETNLTATCQVEVIQELQPGENIITIGNGTISDECVPICNWYMNSFIGSECLYLKNQLADLKAGDVITSIAFYLMEGSAQGGNFNVRMKNTSISSLKNNASAYDTSCIEVNCNDPVNGNVTLEPYSGGQWIEFPLSTPFIYNGENIIIDIRNTTPGTRKGWCYFATTTYNGVRRSLNWIFANSEDPHDDGFSSGGIFSYENSSNLPNIKINYIDGEVYAINTVEIDHNVDCVKYYNLNGFESDTPFPGINIKVTTYSDGTKSAIKIFE